MGVISVVIGFINQLITGGGGGTTLYESSKAATDWPGDQGSLLHARVNGRFIEHTHSTGLAPDKTGAVTIVLCHFIRVRRETLLFGRDMKVKVGKQIGSQPQKWAPNVSHATNNPS